MNFYPFHIGDYRSGTAHLTDAEDLAYRRALDWYYDTEARIPLDTQWVSRRLRVDTKVLENVLRDFFVQTPEGWMHVRCEEEIAAYQALRDRNRANGAKGGRKPAQKEPSGNPVGSEPGSDGQAPETQPQANQEPLTKNQEPLTKESITDVIDKPRRKRAGKSASLSADDLVAHGVDAAHAADWMTVRKAKGLPLTATAWQQVVSEAAMAGLTPAQAVQMAAAEGWGGFKASWVERRTPLSIGGGARFENKQEAIEARNQQVADDWLRQQGFDDEGAPL